MLGAKLTGAVGHRGLQGQGGTTGAKMARAIGPKVFGPRPISVICAQYAKSQT